MKQLSISIQEQLAEAVQLTKLYLLTEQQEQFLWSNSDYCSFFTPLKDKKTPGQPQAKAAPAVLPSRQIIGTTARPKEAPPPSPAPIPSAPATNTAFEKTESRDKVPEKPKESQPSPPAVFFQLEPLKEIPQRDCIEAKQLINATFPLLEIISAPEKQTSKRSQVMIYHREKTSVNLAFLRNLQFAIQQLGFSAELVSLNKIEEPAFPSDATLLLLPAAVYENTTHNGHKLPLQPISDYLTQYPLKRKLWQQLCAELTRLS